MARYGQAYYEKQGDFGVILNNIHNRMKQNLTFREDKKTAEEIEAILKEFKVTARQLREQKSGLRIVDKVNEEAADLIQDIFEEQIKIHTSFKNNAKETALFRRQHSFKKGSSIEGTDDIFEEEIAFFLLAAAKKAKIKNFKADVNIFLMGQQGASVKAMGSLSKEVEEQFQNITKTAAQDYKRSAQAASKLGGVAQVRAGKVDIRAPKVEVEGDISSLSSRIMQLFSGHTFSLKNYSSFKKIEDKISQKGTSQISIHLGDSNFYKSITGSLSSIYSNVKTQNTIYYRGMQYLTRQTEPPDTTDISIVEEHFAHLRFIYELRGEGLISENGESQIADFIIWNDPNSDNVIVRSTNELINRLAKNYTNPFASIGITAADLIG